MGESKFVQLVDALIKEQRMDLIPLVTKDEALRDEYYKKYKIQ